MLHPFNRAFWHRDHLTTTWEYKTLAFILRAIVAVVVVMYLIFALPSIWAWAQTAYVRTQPPEQAVNLMATAIDSGAFEPLVDWLRRRPQAEIDQHAQLVEDNISEVPFIFIGWPLQAAAARDDVEAMLFWQMLTRYRMRFDLLRCGNPVLIERTNQLVQSLAPFQPGAEALAAIERDPQRLAAILQKVLDYDAKNPARNDPRHTCESFKSLTQINAVPMPREGWANARHILRLVTEEAVAKMQAGEVPTDLTPAPMTEPTP